MQFAMILSCEVQMIKWTQILFESFRVQDPYMPKYENNGNQ